MTVCRSPLSRSLLGVKRTWAVAPHMSAYDPKRTCFPELMGSTGVIEFWNAGAERLYGFDQSEAVGHVSHDLLRTQHPIELAELRSKLRSERHWSGELRHMCKD